MICWGDESPRPERRRVALSSLTQPIRDAITGVRGDRLDRLEHIRSAAEELLMALEFSAPDALLRFKERLAVALTNADIGDDDDG